MSAKPQKQHFITKSFMKQWADDTGNVGVVCLHHRSSGLVSPGGLHHTRHLSSPERETQWSQDEEQAKDVLKSFREKLGPNSDKLEEAEEYLSDSEHLDKLVEFIALHHARSLVAALQQFMDPDASGGSAESEASIQERLEAVRDHYGRCGIEVVVYPEDTPVALGAIPVFDAQDWGGRPPGTARFIMPLTPHSTIGGTPDRPPGEVRVVFGSADHETLVLSQLAGVPRLYSSPYLICEPSALERTSEAALAPGRGRQLALVRHTRPHRTVRQVCSRCSTCRLAATTQSARSQPGHTRRPDHHTLHESQTTVDHGRGRPQDSDGPR